MYYMYMYRYEGSIGLAPATLLALTDYDFNAPDAGIFKEEKGPFSVVSSLAG